MAADVPKLKVFISWAGEHANIIGTGFQEFLPDVINNVQPFISGVTIDKGTRWSDALNSSLQDSSCAIVCLTPESAKSIWVAFEAGAISRAAGGADGARSRIWTYLSGLETTDLQLTPFAEYQATKANQEETYRLIRSMNQLSPDPVSAETLKRRFDGIFWPNFAKVLETAAKQPSEERPQSTAIRASESDLLAEILKTVRSLQRETLRAPVSAAKDARWNEEFTVQALENALAELREGSAPVAEQLLADALARRLKEQGAPCLMQRMNDGGLRLTTTTNTIALRSNDIRRILRSNDEFEKLLEHLKRVPSPGTSDESANPRQPQ